MRYYCFGHHKCATNWLRQIMRSVALEKSWNYKVVNGGGKSDLNYNHTDMSIVVNINAKYEHVQLMESDALGVHLIRDPRDALVSDYFSTRYSHTNNSSRRLEVRRRLEQLETEDGLIEMLDFFAYGDQVSTWDFAGNDNIKTIRYENLLQHTEETIKDMLHYLGIDVNETFVKTVVDNTSFEKLSKGRSPGQEDIRSHYRKGTAGDWKQYFTPPVISKFKRKYGAILINMDYENNFDW